MNYRHAYHAGNFADIMKHVVLTRILLYLARKEAPFRVIDTHAGIGLYDLASREAEATAEWRGGVGRLDAPFPPAVEDLLEPFRTVLGACRGRHGPAAYPGSPAILRELLRPRDRAIVIERHPADGDALMRRFNSVSTIKVLQGDGWSALAGLIPPRERRGMVLIDPPYEEPDELQRAVGRIARAHRRWPGGMFALWYPIKHAREVSAFAEAFRGDVPAPVLRLELTIDRPEAGTALAGSGLAIINPPWSLADEATVLLPALADRFGSSRSGFLIERPPSADEPAGREP